MLNTTKNARSVSRKYNCPFGGPGRKAISQLFAKFHFHGFFALALITALLSLSGCQKNEQSKEKVAAGPASFASPDAAAKALYEAAKSGDVNRVYSIFGQGSREYLLPGEASADTSSLRAFTDDFQQMHRWSKSTDGGMILEVGAENYPFPFPLRENSPGQWSFEAVAGRKEILARRIGDNELSAMQVLQAMADAQTDYFSRTHDGSKIHQYAQKFISDPGKQNGLYWKPAENEPESPLGPLAAQAAAEGHPGQTTPPTPFHGYFYRMLTKQGAHAKGGAKDYIVSASMTRGFAFLAYPAEYRKSGVMTFLINQGGLIYQCDLGEKTAELAQQIDSFNPDDSWQPVQ